jgi:hypothetical protein
VRRRRFALVAGGAADSRGLRSLRRDELHLGRKNGERESIGAADVLELAAS